MPKRRLTGDSECGLSGRASGLADLESDGSMNPADLANFTSNGEFEAAMYAVDQAYEEIGYTASAQCRAVRERAGAITGRGRCGVVFPTALGVPVAFLMVFHAVCVGVGREAVREGLEHRNTTERAL